MGVLFYIGIELASTSDFIYEQLKCAAGQGKEIRSGRNTRPFCFADMLA